MNNTIGWCVLKNKILRSLRSISPILYTSNFENQGKLYVAFFDWILSRNTFKIVTVKSFTYCAKEMFYSVDGFHLFTYQ